jgi:hypothetical protein
MDGVQPTRQRKAPPERGQSPGWPAPPSRPLGGLPAGPWLIIGWPECKARPRGAAAWGEAARLLPADGQDLVTLSLVAKTGSAR